jgi:molecular chaperone DnaK (HSP70)
MKTTFCFVLGGRYVVVDCGGGTVDITVHEIDSKDGHLKELFRATGGAYGSVSE